MHWSELGAPAQTSLLSAFLDKDVSLHAVRGSVNNDDNVSNSNHGSNGSKPRFGSNRSTISSLGPRELANVFWSLGKLNFCFRAASSSDVRAGKAGGCITDEFYDRTEYFGNTVHICDAGNEEGSNGNQAELLRLQEAVGEQLLQRLEHVSHSLSAFDFESIMVSEYKHILGLWSDMKGMMDIRGPLLRM